MARHWRQKSRDAEKGSQTCIAAGARVAQTLKQSCFQGYPKSAAHVQVLVGSRNPATHSAHHTSLRPSSMFEPRHPSPRDAGRKSGSPLEKHQAITQCAENTTAGQERLHPANAAHERMRQGIKFISIFAHPLTGHISQRLVGGTRMILPQVHLRKPCYDFSFL